MPSFSGHDSGAATTRRPRARVVVAGDGPAARRVPAGRPRLRLLLAVLGLAAAAAPLRAQFADRAQLPWRTVESPHFRYIFPRALEPWALPVAARFEAVRTAVDALVGYTPSKRVTVVMDDPVTISNGLTLPELNAPTILFLATPPGPRTEIGDNPGWGEILSVHEYAHEAHMARPSRNPKQRFLERLPWLPTDFGPIARRTPRWVTEGYATYVEGRITGSGRPHGVWRAAVLRQWALEGKLPSYGAMSGLAGYRGGSLAYLAGSAYWEWLLDLLGPGARADSALPHVWRRLTARQSRSFGAAFAGVFPGAPADLYDRFRVDVTTRAAAVRRRLADVGLVEGDTVQALDWQTGDPALSRDGAHLAIVLRSRDFPSRVVVWNTAAEPPDTAAERRRTQLLRKDPEDVPAIPYRPRPKKALATLWPAAGGRSYDNPRFLPDGEHILLTRFEPGADGSRVPDLVIWDWKRGGVRRVTHGAAIVSADPAPDGRSALAERCRWGACELVRVNLADGSLATVAPGAPDSVIWSRPRVSPDGRSIAAAVQRRGRWKAVLLDADGRNERPLVPDGGAQRYDPAFLPDGSAVVVTSEEGGIPNLEVVGLAGGGARPITRVTGAAMAPEPARDGSVYFLRLHAGGLDLARARADARIGLTVALDSALTPAAPLPLAPDRSYPVTPLRWPGAYGLGPRGYRLIPSVGVAGGRIAGRVALASTDPVGRLGWLAQGAFGRTDWAGASLRMVYRGFRPQPQLDVFGTRYRPDSLDARQQATGLGERIDYRGAAGALQLQRSTGAGEYELRAGVSAGRLSGEVASGQRTFGYAELGLVRELALGPSSLGVALDGNGSLGRTAGADWQRLVASAALGVHPAGGGISGGVRILAGTLAGDAAGFERFSVGGEEPPLFDGSLMPQQVSMPALPAAALVGRRVLAGRASLDWAGATFYFWGARAQGGTPGWQRVIGAEQEVDTDPIPLLRIPGIHALIGVGYTLDEQPRSTWRVYGMTTLRP
ncbi:MAG TPA: hypothetical protein VF832_01145 [Longimicrobiales bacterium]